MAIGKVAAHLCLMLIIKELKINVEQDRVLIIFSVLNTTKLHACSCMYNSIHIGARNHGY